MAPVPLVLVSLQQLGYLSSTVVLLVLYLVCPYRHPAPRMVVVDLASVGLALVLVLALVSVLVALGLGMAALVNVGLSVTSPINLCCLLKDIEPKSVFVCVFGELVSPVFCWILHKRREQRNSTHIECKQGTA